MSQHPEKKLTVDDIPVAINGAACFGIQACATGGFDVTVDGRRLDHKSSEQAALREAIRRQKRANRDGGAKA
ncbi:hypothetical protein [Neoaquamicrobium sediminum]|uniref:hypothetical protein n=1 Tax=Neoaquamicrobium sediminum TaxID=1849104 RepID=UPI001565D120|nr:hypothetical protein [Mesorhizobium sediminum]NRC54174.1 hypothetical protein [Mesorhizobium sediminum]